MKPPHRPRRSPRSLLGKALLAALLVAGIGVLSVEPSRAAINKQVNFQGRLTDTAGNAVLDGTYNVEFKLYTVASAGTAQWTETRSGASKVTVSRGLFSVQLGEVASLASFNFNQDPLYLSVNIGGTGATPVWDGEMSPRHRLGAAPQAIEANHALSADTATNATTANNATQLNGNTAGNASGQISLNNGTVNTNLNADLLDGQSGAFYQNATNINAGTLADGQLSTNVPLKNAANTFSASQTISNNGGATTLNLSNTTAGVGLTIGGDTNLYRSAADTLKTDDNFQALSLKQNGNNVCDASNNCNFATSANAFVQGGNSFGTTGVLGTNDANDLQLKTGGTAKLTVQNSTGNVGIGTTAPGTKLDVAGNVRAGNSDTVIGTHASYGTGFSAFFRQGSDYSLLTDGTNTFLNAPLAGGDIAIRTGNQEKVRIQGSTGNVGIGTATPGYKLQVEGTTALSLPTYAGAGIPAADAQDFVRNSFTFNDTTPVAISNTTLGATSKWKVILRGYWANNHEGSGLAQPPPYIELTSESPSIAIGSITLTLSRNATSGKLQGLTSSSVAAKNIVFSGTAEVIANNLSAAGTTSLALQGGITLGADTNLYRSAADTLKTDDNFVAGNGLTVAAGSLNHFGTFLNLSAANPVINFGATSDTNLYRSAANELKTDDTFSAAGYKVGATAGATTACAGGQFLQNQVVTGGITTGGTCAAASGGGTTTLQGAYDNDATGVADIVTTSAAKTVLVKAGTGFDSTSLFNVQNAGGTSVFNVDTTNGKIIVGSNSPQSNALISAVQAGNSLEFGHANPAGYHSTLGAEAGTGRPFLGFSAEAGSTANTYRTRGIAGSVVQGNLAGGVAFGTLAANADNQALSKTLELTSTGALQFGAAGDTNLYRSAADTLKTDDSFKVGVLSVTGTPTLTTYDGGTLDGTYTYAIVAVDAGGGTTTASTSSAPCVTDGGSPLGVTGTCIISWTAVSGASYYRIYRNNSVYFTTTGTSFADDGSAGGTAGSAPTSNTTHATMLSATGASIFNNNVGIGGTPGTNKLYVAGSNSSGYIARFNNDSTATTADGLLIDLGVANASRTTGNYFIGFAGSGVVAGKIQGGANAVAYTTTGADYAEYFRTGNTADKPQAGEVVMLDKTQDKAVVKSTSAQGLVGVVSDNPGFVGNGPLCKTEDDNCDKDHAQGNTLVGITGQLKTKVSTLNGPIQTGDDITASSIAGTGTKLAGRGEVVGKALESFDPAAGKGAVSPCPAGAPEGVVCGTVAVHVDPHYTDAATDGSIQGSTASFADLNVSGKATIANLEVKDLLTTQRLTVEGDAEIKGNAKVGKDLEVSGNVKLGDNTKGTNVSIAEGDAELTVTFKDAQADADYNVQVTPGWDAGAYVTDKKPEGFTIKFKQAPADATLDWILTR